MADEITGEKQFTPVLRGTFSVRELLGKNNPVQGKALKTVESNPGPAHQSATAQHRDSLSPGEAFVSAIWSYHPG